MYDSSNVSILIANTVANYLSNAANNSPLNPVETLTQLLEDNIPSHTFNVIMDNHDELVITVKVTPRNVGVEFELKF